MTRSTLSAANRAEATAPVVRCAVLLDIAFPSGTIRTSSGDREITVNGNAYTPGAVLVEDPAGIAETVDLRARRITVKLSGVDAALVTKLMNDDYHFAQGNVSLAFLNEAGGLVGDPYPVGHALFLSQATIALDQASGVAEVSFETMELLDARSSAQLATSASQRARYPGDSGMDAVRAIMEMEAVWGNRFLGGASNEGGADNGRDTRANQ